MVIIYDFDGTLTPYSLPQYEILKRIGYDDEKLMKLVKEKMKNDGISLYLSYFKTFKELLLKNGILFNKKNIILGVEETKFNNGVLNYFRDLQYQNTGIRHFIISSGLSDYILNTSLSNYIDGVFGTTFFEKNEEYTELKTLMTDEEKVLAIRQIQSLYSDFEKNDIIYFGDGLTDKKAFEYVHSIGGKSIFVSNDITERNSTLTKLQEMRIIDEYFKLDFDYQSDIYHYVKQYQRRNFDSLKFNGPNVI